jgi:hypothetical protein
VKLCFIGNVESYKSWRSGPTVELEVRGERGVVDVNT